MRSCSETRERMSGATEVSRGPRGWPSEDLLCFALLAKFVSLSWRRQEAGVAEEHERLRLPWGSERPSSPCRKSWLFSFVSRTSWWSSAWQGFWVRPSFPGIQSTSSCVVGPLKSFKQRRGFSMAGCLEVPPSSKLPHCPCVLLAAGDTSLTRHGASSYCQRELLPRRRDIGCSRQRPVAMWILIGFNVGLQGTIDTCSAYIATLLRWQGYLWAGMGSAFRFMSSKETYRALPRHCRLPSRGRCKFAKAPFSSSFEAVRYDSRGRKGWRRRHIGFEGCQLYLQQKVSLVWARLGALPECALAVGCRGR